MREVRSSRLTEMLDQTGACLATFAQRLGLGELLAQHARKVQTAADKQAGLGAQAGNTALTPNGSSRSAGEQGWGSSGVGGAGGGEGGEGTDVLQGSEMWAALSRALVADVAEQPRMLQQVTLRDYQMQVSRTFKRVGLGLICHQGA